MTLRHKNLQMDQRIVSIYRILKKIFFALLKIAFLQISEKNFGQCTDFQFQNFLILSSYWDNLEIIVKKISSLTSFACPIAHF